MESNLKTVQAQITEYIAILALGVYKSLIAEGKAPGAAYQEVCDDIAIVAKNAKTILAEAINGEVSS